MPRVTFDPLGKSFDVRPGGSLLRAARRARVPLASSCAGDGSCRSCRVRVIEGAEHLSPRTDREQFLARLEFWQDGERLACLARVSGPVRVTTTYW